jgi:hypothetical protein
VAAGLRFFSIKVDLCSISQMLIPFRRLAV